MTVKHETRDARIMNAHIAARREAAPVPSPKDPDHLRDVAYEISQISYRALMDTVARYGEYRDSRGNGYSEPSRLFQNVNTLVNSVMMTNGTKHRPPMNRCDLSLGDQQIFGALCALLQNVFEEGMTLLLPCNAIMESVKRKAEEFSQVTFPARLSLTWEPLH
ncbi:MAG TPA: hypothetical protein VNQ78_07135 [Paracoccus sp. (in: a-proteobacteria)]|uniref:hypothetical protein n=1 Tax=Paracoccus sp. TaxID=267 RepID=UPI002BE1FF09|nr:hypothetical protein [Paracoccus sp. (in: a-proteobacteria)]HWL56437.1 hypothetical protein [Paracoccus sp. (in: a-proteobacteria)]